MAWLYRQPAPHLGAEWRAQPWRQLEETFEEIGEPLEARRLAVARERARRAAGQVALFRNQPLRGQPLGRRLGRALGNLGRWVVNLPVNALHRLYGFTVGYGYFNLRALIPVIALIALGTALFSAAWEDNTIAPPLPFVLQSAQWEGCADEPNQAACWVRQENPGSDYYQFNSFYYSLDVFLPIVTIEQEHSWAPAPGRGTPLAETSWIKCLRSWLPPEYDAWLVRRFEAWGPGARVATYGDVAWSYRLIHEILGYVLSGFIIAGLSRLIRDQ